MTSLFSFNKYLHFVFDFKLFFFNFLYKLMNSYLRLYCMILYLDKIIYLFQ